MSRASWRDRVEDEQGRRPRRQWSSLLPGLRGWVWGAAVAFVAVAGAGAATKALQQGRVLPLERVAVTEAPQRVDDAQLREVLAPYLHRSLLGVDVQGARDALEGLPWVAKAQVRRAWPGTVRVTLVERRPLARWGGGGLVDRDGVRFAPAAETIPEGLPRLRGPKGSAEKVAALFRKLQATFKGQEVAITALSLSQRGSWRAELAGGVTMALGRQRPQERAARFAAALPALKEREQAPMERVDLRYPNGFAVAWGAAEESD
ncbi:MAG: cell division protein FtsQ/DivIB [Halorhodospira sp.]